MNTHTRRVVFILALTALLSLTQSLRATDSLAPSNTSSNPAQDECAIIAAIHSAAKAGNGSSADTLLMQASALNPSEAPSVTLARRAVAVCGWLQDDDLYGAAIKLAQRTEAKLSNLTETNDADHAERLYWEAVLVGRVLDQKAKAVALLEAAHKIAPNDDRAAELELGFAKSLNEFGH